MNIKQIAIVNDKDIEIIWPEEGALATPIYTLIKKEKADFLNMT